MMREKSGASVILLTPRHYLVEEHPLARGSLHQFITNDGASCDDDAYACGRGRGDGPGRRRPASDSDRKKCEKAAENKETGRKSRQRQPLVQSALWSIRA